MNVEEKVKAKDGHEKEQVTNEEEEEYLTDVGFMFDCHHSRDRIEIQFEKFAVSINCIDEDPGHVQSGQHLWPGATLLSNYLCKIWSDRQYTNVIELGAGCGLCSIVCSKLIQFQQMQSKPSVVSKICVTDYDPGALQIIQDNININPIEVSKLYSTDSNNKFERFHNIQWSVENIKWGDDLKLNTLDNSTEIPSPMLSPGYDLIIGSDLIYCTGVIQPLFCTVDQIIQQKTSNMDRQCVFILAFSFDIGEESHNELNRCIELYQLKQTNINPNTRLELLSNSNFASLCNATDRGMGSNGSTHMQIYEFSKK